MKLQTVARPICYMAALKCEDSSIRNPDITQGLQEKKCKHWSERDSLRLLERYNPIRVIHIGHEMGSNDRIVIIGAGVFGLSLAYQLASSGNQNVTVMDRHVPPVRKNSAHIASMT